MNLKQKTFFFVGLSVAALLLVYVAFSNYYVRQQESQFFDDRKGMALAISEEFTGFFTRGVDRLQMVAGLPALVYGLQTLQETREGKQLPTWTTLHYLFYETDIFTDGVFLLNGRGKILWSYPPDQDLLETDFPENERIATKLREAAGDVAIVVSEQSPEARILIASPVNDGEGQMVGALVGAMPVSHPAIGMMLQRNPPGHGTTQLLDESGLVIASTDPSRRLRPYGYLAPADGVIMVSHAVAPWAWAIAIDQSAAEALTDIRSLKTLLTAFGIVFMLIAMASLLFILRSFTRPVEMLTAAARQIADGDLSGGFTLDRNDEIGILGKTLDDMKTKLKSSYDLLLQSEKMSLMGQVVAGIAHELNNPLTIVIGNVQLLMMREVNQKNLQSLGRIRDGADRASKIVKNLLTFARQEKPERKPTDINKVLEKTLELRAYELKVSNIEVSINLAPDLPETMADAHQLQQVFLNLIVNAEHAMLASHGKGLLRMTTRAGEGKIMVFVSDDGPGIPKEGLQRIFEPFYTTKGVGKGTGLGLSICQGIIKEHGGNIDVESTTGRGTTFVIELPVLRWVPEPLPAPALTGHSAGPARKRILVVEDELQIRQLFEEVLRAHGHQVETADNGRVALDLIDRTNYDLIISDVKMPEISGPELYAAIKRRGTALEQRVIFVTGDLMNPETLQFIESTGRAWLGKPFDIDSITRTVSDCLNTIHK